MFKQDKDHYSNSSSTFREKNLPLGMSFKELFWEEEIPPASLPFHTAEAFISQALRRLSSFPDSGTLVLYMNKNIVPSLQQQCLLILPAPGCLLSHSRRCTVLHLDAPYFNIVQSSTFQSTFKEV